jgi:hypothetical protein
MAGRVLKVLEEQGLLKASGKTIVVYNARPKMRPRPVAVPPKGGKDVKSTRPEVSAADGSEDDDW